MLKSSLKCLIYLKRCISRPSDRCHTTHLKSHSLQEWIYAWMEKLIFFLLYICSFGEDSKWFLSHCVVGVTLHMWMEKGRIKRVGVYHFIDREPVREENGNHCEHKLWGWVLAFILSGQIYDLYQLLCKA